MENPHLNNPEFSVIMLIYHRNEELVEMAKQCWNSVRENSPLSTEFIIVDNGSSAGYDWEKHCDVYIRFNQNMGISDGWNAGLKVSRGKYKVVIGDDTLMPPKWLEGMREAFDYPDCGVVNPYVEHLPLGVGIVENYKWPSGACFMLTQDTLDKVGYFDEKTYFPCNWEDWDYWLRVYKAGLKMYRNYSVKIRHKEGQTINSSELKQSPTREAFIKKWGFDATPIFCADTPMPQF